MLKPTDPLAIDSPPPLRGLLMRGAVWMVAMRWVMRGLGLLNIVVLARLLSPEDFGLIAMAMVIIGFADSVLSFGVDRAIIQKGGNDTRYFDTGWTIRVGQTLSVAAIAAASAPIIARIYGEPRVSLVIWIIAAATALRAFENIGTVAFRKDLQFAKEFQLNVVAQLVSVPVTIGLALYYGSYLALAIGILSRELLSTILSYVFSPYRPRFSLVYWRDIWSFSQWNVVHSIGMSVQAQVPTAMIGALGGPATVGKLGLAIELALMPTAEIVAPIARVLVPGFVKLRDDPERSRAAFMNAFAAIVLISTPFCLGLAAVAPELVPVMLGQKWLSIVTLMQIFAILGLLRVIQSCFTEQVMVLDRVSLVALGTWLNAGLIVASTYPAFQYWGIEGVAIAWVFVLILSVVVFGGILRHLTKISAGMLLRSVVRPIASGVAMLAVLAAVDSILVAPLVIVLVAKMLIGAIVYVSVALGLWWADGARDGLEKRVMLTATSMLQEFWRR